MQEQREIPAQWNKVGATVSSGRSIVSVKPRRVKRPPSQGAVAHRDGGLLLLRRNRQTTPRIDRHETIVTGRCETFRYPAHGNACQVHLDERFLHAALPATIPLDDGCLEGHALEPRHVERDITGGRGEVFNLRNLLYLII